MDIQIKPQVNLIDSNKAMISNVMEQLDKLYENQRNNKTQIEKYENQFIPSKKVDSAYRIRQTWHCPRPEVLPAPVCVKDFIPHETLEM